LKPSSSTTEERGVDWEWTDITFPSMGFGAWYGDHRFPLTHSIVEVATEQRGWICLIDEPTLVIGAHRSEERILVMRKKKE
jgi:hypothetical protein